jgi:hypothetical protein
MNSAWRISNKSSVKSRTHKLFVALPSKHATIIGLIRFAVTLILDGRTTSKFNYVNLAIKGRKEENYGVAEM